MNLSLQNLPTLVDRAAAACQQACNKLLNLTSGSVTRAILEANASVALWIQYLVVQYWNGQRLSTSSGSDVDTFVGDFGLTRLPAVAASGTATFSRSGLGISSIVIPYFNADGTINTSGAQVITADRSQSFGVLTDTTNPAWNTVSGGYSVPSTTASVDLPVQALAAGSAGNIQADSISLIASSIPGLDLVTNATALSNGVDAETDNSLRARFQVFIATRARATLAAVQSAIQAVQQDLSFSIIENTLPNGQQRPGFFTVTIDDGTGSPPNALITLVYASIDSVRPIGSTFTVQPPAILGATVTMTITAASGFSKPVLQGQVANSIESYINSLGIGQALSYTRLSALAFGVQGVANVSNVRLNGGTTDVGGGPTQVVKATGASVVIN